MEREDVRIAVGGEECAAWLFRPAAAADGVPCVVMGSGLSCVRDQGMEAFGERFARAGIAALAFDYRHFGDSDGEPRALMSASRQREDFRAALARARSLDWVDPDRVALWGYSMGGAHVQALAAAEPRVAAAVCTAPVVDTVATILHIGGPVHLPRLVAAGARDRARALRGAEPFRLPVAGPPGSRAVLNSPDSVPGFQAITPPGSSWRDDLCARAAMTPPYRLLRTAGRIRCPILVCVMDADDVAPPRLASKVAERAPRGELRRYAAGHFDPFLGETFERVAADQAEFLARHLLGQAKG